MRFMGWRRRCRGRDAAVGPGNDAGRRQALVHVRVQRRERRHQSLFVQFEQHQTRGRREIAAAQAGAHRGGDMARADRVEHAIQNQPACQLAELRIELRQHVTVLALDRLRHLLGRELFFQFVFVWVRWTLPRFRYDRLMDFGWKGLFQIALANVVVTAVLVAYGVIGR